MTSAKPALLFPGVELARRLVDAGHRVTYASSAAAREIAERHGMEFVALEPGGYDEFLARDARAGPVRRLRELESRRRQAIESLAVSALVPVLTRVEPDLILIEGEMHEHIIVASRTGVPIALLNSFVAIWRRPGLPPPHCMARPGVGWKGTRLGMWLLWAELRFRKRRRAWAARVRRVGCDRVSLLRQLARDTGFDLRRETDASQWLIPFTYTRLPVLSLHAREFDFPHRPPENVTYVGPLQLEERGDQGMAGNAADDLESILARCRSEGRGLVYAGFGSFFSTDVDLVLRLVSAVSSRPDLELVISLGGRLEAHELGPLPDRVHCFRWLPQVEVLRHADVAVVHGGVTTVDECVLATVPMLVYCGFETDMGGTTSRVVHHGIGLAGDRRRDSPEVIGRHLDRLLAEPRFRDNLRRLRVAYESYVSERVLERAVEELLGSAVARPEQ